MERDPVLRKIVHSSLYNKHSLCDCILHPEAVVSNSPERVTCKICKKELIRLINEHQTIKRLRKIHIDKL